MSRSSPRRLRTLIGGSAVLGAGLLAALPAALPASAAPAARPPVPAFRPGPARYDVGVRSGVTRAQAGDAARSAASPSFPQFRASIRAGNTSYSYVMVGRNPAVRTAHASVTIGADLVPLVIRFRNGDTWNPASVDSCDRGASPLARVQRSPIAVRQSWKFGGTPVGAGQVTDAFQRAEFWRYARPGAVNPSYGDSLAITTLAPVTVNVPTADAAVHSIGCGNHALGAVNIDWLDPYLRNKVLPSLAREGAGPARLPIFLLHNVVEYVGNTADCCVLGYHNAYRAARGIQTYALAMYDNSRAFPGSSDISALSHEVAEWQDDPYGNNPTPAWGHTGQVAGCQANLEVGDPLSGTLFTDRVGGFAYHPQQLAFFSWFYHQRPSIGVNGWYSDQGKFRTPAAPCR